MLSLIWMADRTEQARYHQVQEADLYRALLDTRTKLETALYSRLLLTKGLTAHVSTHPNISQNEFQTIAAALVNQGRLSGIRSIQLARNTIVTHVYPLKGNEQSVGLRLSELAGQKKAVQRALATKNTVVEGPVRFNHGDTVFISRTPIYLVSSGSSGPSCVIPIGV